MSTKQITDTMLNSTLTTMTHSTQVTFAKCDCCGLIEECTPTYIQSTRETYHGKWLCGLCGEAVKDEMVRNKRLMSTKEAVKRHMDFCGESRSPESPHNSAVQLIAAMRLIIRRGLDSPIRSMPNSPVRNTDNVRKSQSYTDLQDLMK